MTKHKHHILPRHAGGTNDPDNLIEVTVEEHAEIHRCLWVYGGRWQDEVAWRTLSGQITFDEARRMAVSRALKNKPQTEEHKKKRSLKLQGKKHKQESKDQIGESNKYKLVGKTWEEIYGLERAHEKKQKMSHDKSGEGNPNFGKIGYWAGRIGPNKGKKLPARSKHMINTKEESVEDMVVNNE
jgi:hypothetical protein